MTAATDPGAVPGRRTSAAEPQHVTLHVWGVPTSQVASALLAMARDRGPVRRTRGLTFGKLLGTGDGRTFTVRDADPHHWALLACWSDVEAALAFEASPLVRRWDARAFERLTVTMTPVASTGRWSGTQPFETLTEPPRTGPVAAITRARLRASKARTFWQAVPAVSRRLQSSPGLLASLGIGEAPVGLQGTFSLWESAAALRAFAYHSPEHQAVVARTAPVGWYAEDLFARFAVRSVEGTLAGRRLDISTSTQPDAAGADQTPPPVT